MKQGAPGVLGISDHRGRGPGPPPRRGGPARHIAEEAVRSRDAGRRRPAVSTGPQQPLLLGLKLFRAASTLTQTLSSIGS